VHTALRLDPGAVVSLPVAGGVVDARQSAYAPEHPRASRPQLAHPASSGVPVADNQHPSERSPDRAAGPGAVAMFGTLTGIATLSAVLVVGGAGLGLLVDDWTSAPHVFVFVGLVLGVLAAVFATRSIVRRFFQ
jgi:hypothetical protein